MELNDKMASLAAQRADAEQLIVEHVCANSRAAMFLLDSYGVTVDHFDQPDLAGIFGAVRLHVRDEKIVQAECCRRILQKLGHWDASDTRNFVSGMWWSNEKLAALFTQTRYDSQILTVAVAELLFVLSINLKLSADATRGRRVAA